MAAYTGLRMPSGWTATLQAVSLQGGFHRRFLVGSLLHPIASRTGYPYPLFAAVSFAVLAGIVTVLVRAAVTARNPARRYLVLGFLLLPSGGYLFHEVGYFDQVLYLFLFASLWLLARGRVLAASLLIAAAATVHEITVLTVLPLFVLAAVRSLPTRRAVASVLPAAVVGAVVLLVPASSGGAPRALGTVLSAHGFPVRSDALALFGRTQSASWHMYSPWQAFLFLLPLVLVVGAVVLRVCHQAGSGGLRLTVLSAGAALSPSMLALAGWDMERWAFLLVANFCIVLWFWLGEHPVPMRRFPYGLPMAALLLTVHVPLAYFDGYQPRALTGKSVTTFVEHVTSGRIVHTPAH
ncbi:hypothetical protein [Yinghuangia seranimata]|uniref:hypothetical protein n=1 Tax=Yinghuangia seranimata TaxID=408067 RepID=UPI00248B9885|nr:hypothetical protein [Yinghuangia seranimata]MDI2125035.1 hypothetical protein [Yinghuangia seranimata]